VVIGHQIGRYRDMIWYYPVERVSGKDNMEDGIRAVRSTHLIYVPWISLADERSPVMRRADSESFLTDTIECVYPKTRTWVPRGESSDGHRFFAEEHEIIQGEGI